MMRQLFVLIPMLIDLAVVDLAAVGSTAVDDAAAVDSASLIWLLLF